MGHRLTRIYTRTGDDGTTGLGDGSRVAKDCARVEVIGAVDELNSAIGLILAEPVPDAVREVLLAVQHDLFEVGAELAVPGRTGGRGARVEWIEQALDRFNADLPALREFILPGGGAAAAACHLARSICRRAERRAVALARSEAVSATPVQYLNRLSDLLFVMARVAARAAGVAEVFWEPRRDGR
jgi:cob(I)alamin adenosyltransferase